MVVIDAFCEGNDMSNFGSGHSCGECHDWGFVQRCSTNQHQLVCFSWYYFSSMHLLISANTLWQAPLTCSCACPTRDRATLEDHNLRTSSLSTEWFCSFSSTITDYSIVPNTSHVAMKSLYLTCATWLKSFALERCATSAGASSLEVTFDKETAENKSN